tara:strand:- start:1901 stop:2194 length:294 start_codon:yes stop_codon:yes gene_type:complete
MKIYVDIDETICFYNSEKKYQLAIPSYKNIKKINKLFDEGNRIIYWTARGQRSKNDYSELTITQLNDWGCKYHEVICNQKPDYDLLICDKTKRIEEV